MWASAKIDEDNAQSLIHTCVDFSRSEKNFSPVWRHDVFWWILFNLGVRSCSGKVGIPPGLELLAVRKIHASVNGATGLFHTKACCAMRCATGEIGQRRKTIGNARWLWSFGVKRTFKCSLGSTKTWRQSYRNYNTRTLMWRTPLFSMQNWNTIWWIIH